MNADYYARWLPLARRQHAEGKTNYPFARCQIKAMLGPLWTDFAQENGLLDDCIDTLRTSNDTLTPVTFVHVVQPISPTQAAPTDGVGSRLKSLLAASGLVGHQGCGCNDYAALMNVWGVEGCTARRTEIIAWLKNAAGQQGWLSLLAGGVRAVWAGWGLKVSPIDPIGSLVDLAIEQAKTSQSPT